MSHTCKYFLQDIKSTFKDLYMTVKWLFMMTSSLQSFKTDPSALTQIAVKTFFWVWLQTTFSSLKQKIMVLLEVKKIHRYSGVPTIVTFLMEPYCIRISKTPSALTQFALTQFFWVGLLATFSSLNLTQTGNIDFVCTKTINIS